MKSLRYVILYFIRGFLSWQGLKTTSEKQELELILNQKETITIKKLCDGLSNAFTAYFNNVCSLLFEDKSKYSYLCKIFHNLFVQEGFKYNYIFDWTILKYFMTAQ